MSKSNFLLEKYKCLKNSLDKLLDFEANICIKFLLDWCMYAYLVSSLIVNEFPKGLNHVGLMKT